MPKQVRNSGIYLVQGRVNRAVGSINLVVRVDMGRCGALSKGIEFS